MRSDSRVEVANLVPHEDGDLGVAPGCAADFDGHLAQAFVAHDLAADQEGVAGGQGGGEILLDLAERRAASGRAGAP